jgi:hypothetical protein
VTFTRELVEDLVTGSYELVVEKVRSQAPLRPTVTYPGVIHAQKTGLPSARWNHTVSP